MTGEIAEELEEFIELSSDPTEMLFRAMEILERVRAEYCSTEDYLQINILKKAFKLYKGEGHED